MTEPNTPTSPIPHARPTISTLNHLSATGTWPHTTARIEIHSFQNTDSTFLANIEAFKNPHQKFTMGLTSSLIDSPFAFQGSLFHQPDLQHDEGEIHRDVLQGYECPTEVYEDGGQVFEAEFEIMGSDSVGLCWGIVGEAKVRIRIEGEDTDPAFLVEGRKTLFGAGVSVF